MSDVLAVCEQRGGRVRGVSNEVVTAAKGCADAVGGSVHALLFGPADIDAAALGAHGAEVVKVVSGLDEAAPDVVAAAAAEVAREGGYHAFVFPATGSGM